jgi:hypothetical protein
LKSGNIADPQTEIDHLDIVVEAVLSGFSP